MRLLNLTRKVREPVKIGNNVSVTVVDIRDNQVRTGVAVPREFAVDRQAHDREEIACDFN